MTAWVVVLAVLLVIAAIMVFYLEREVVALREGAADDVAHEHAKCIAHITEYLGDHFAANVLDAAADRYESMEGRGECRRLQNTVWEEGGPSIPALYLIEQAARLRAKHE